jgi:hypothetical protein
MSTLKADTVTASTTNGNLSLSGNGTGIVTTNTLKATTTDGDLTLDGNGSGVVAIDTIKASTTNGNLDLQGNGTGAVTMSVQPCFRVTPSGVLSNVTGDATVYTVVFATETFDLGSDFDGASTFTAPITGRYFLQATVAFQSGVTDQTGYDLRIVTSNATYLTDQQPVNNKSAQTGMSSLTNSVIADMDASDTCTIAVRVGGGSAGKVSDIGVGGQTHFSGCLLA